MTVAVNDTLVVSPVEGFVRRSGVQTLFGAWIGKTLAAVMGVAMLAAVPATVYGQAKPAQKKWKDAEEYNMFSAASKDLADKNPTKALQDLNAWKAKYPESDFKDDGTLLYMQAYSDAKEPAKAIDAASALMSQDLNQVFSDPKTGPGQVIKVLYTVCVSIRSLQNPTPEELATAKKAANELMNFDRKPEGVSDADWANARKQLEAVAKPALLYIAVLPGVQAMQKTPKDCPAAEAAFTKALNELPNNSYIAYQLGSAMLCQQKEHPEKIPDAIYEFERAAVIDPTLDGTSKNPKAVETYADTAYTHLHGSDEGLAQLKQQVKQSPLPPAGFTIKTATQVAVEKENEFEQSNPELALWMKIKGALEDTNGDQYFTSSLKDAAVPQLRGTLVEAKPACHPKELLIGVPLPDNKGPLTPEITLKLAEPLKGKPEANADFHFQGIPTAFSKDPFMLTMTVENSKITDLKESPCRVVPTHHHPVRKK
jgi:hypothetical protein